MNQLFNIFRIDAVRAQEIEAMPDEPHIGLLSIKIGGEVQFVKQA